MLGSSLVVPNQQAKPKWPQILLTNDYKFKGKEPVYGASAFLIDTGKDTVACTAKHLLGEAMGIEPAIKTKDFDKFLERWSLYPRTMEGTASTIKINSLINKDESPDDILLMKINAPANNSIKPLTVFRGKLKIGDSLFVAGCEYKETNCKQNIYQGTFAGIDEPYLSVKVNRKLEAAGFSGAPIFNRNNEVVGVIYGRHAEGKVFVFAATPIEKVFKYLGSNRN